jgi:hypothetical protein
MIEKSNFIKLLQSGADPKRICREHLFSSAVWLLEQSASGPPRKTYDDVKLFFGQQLDIANNDVGIVGSAKLGFSLAPNANFRNFDGETSDIDIILVSPTLFRSFWNELFRLFYSADTYVNASNFRSVFLRYVALREDFRPPSEPILEWQRKVGGLKKDFFASFGIGNKVEYRIYESWQAVEAYHIDGIMKLQKEVRT